MLTDENGYRITTGAGAYQVVLQVILEVRAESPEEAKLLAQHRTQAAIDFTDGISGQAQRPNQSFKLQKW